MVSSSMSAPVCIAADPGLQPANGRASVKLALIYARNCRIGTKFALVITLFLQIVPCSSRPNDIRGWILLPRAVLPHQRPPPSLGAHPAVRPRRAVFQQCHGCRPLAGLPAPELHHHVGDSEPGQVPMGSHQLQRHMDRSAAPARWMHQSGADQRDPRI